jgi:hypothetical protein
MGVSSMSEVVNLLLLEEGAKIGLYSGATAEVVSNPKDGVWMFVRYLSSPEDSSLVGTEDMVFAQDILEVIVEDREMP